VVLRRPTRWLSWLVVISSCLGTIASNSEVPMRLAMVALFVGAIAHFRPRPIGPWLLGVAGTSLFCVRAFSPALEPRWLGITDTVGSLCVTTTIWLVTRQLRQRSRWANATATVLALGTFCGFWALFTEHRISDGKNLADALAIDGYLYANVVTIGLLGSLVLDLRRGSPALRQLTVGLSAMWVGDLMFALAGRFSLSWLIDVYSLLYFGGFAVLFFSVSSGSIFDARQLSGDDRGARGGVERAWLLAAGAASPVAVLVLTNHPSLGLRIVSAVCVMGIASVAARAAVRALRYSEQAADQIEQATSYDEVSGGMTFHGLCTVLRDATTTTSVVLVDLRGFGTLNDALGYRHGDLLLHVARSRLSELSGVRAVGRLNGNQFAVVSDEDTAIIDQLAHHMVRQMETPFAIAGRMIRMTAAAGAVTCDAGEDPVRSLQRAEIALRRGRVERAPVRWYDDEVRSSIERGFRIRDSLMSAADRGEIVPAYQPVIDLVTGEVVGLEALCRWRQEDGSLVFPDSFIAIAEETGDIDSIGKVMLDTALHDLRWLQTAGLLPHDAHVAVNVSARQLHDDHLARHIPALLARHDLEGQSLTVELTESLIVDSPAQAAETLGRLRELGVGIALDDFGTGFASIHSLMAFPFTSIKLDRSVVHHACIEPMKGAIVASHVRLAELAGLGLIAEGVELETEREALTRLGVRHAQGYLFSRPLLRDDLIDWLRTRSATGPSIVVDRAIA
jgi:EAL domain-containing protein (putative c-di-GMP-specific phosphodiesterase class I)/GGDEF domain-containing protein